MKKKIFNVEIGRKAIYKIDIEENVERSIDGEWILYDKYVKNVYLFGIRIYSRNFLQRAKPVSLEEKKIGFNKEKNEFIG